MRTRPHARIFPRSMIPEKLARALLGHDHPEAGDFHIVVGRVPDGWPADVTPRNALEVLGGTAVGQVMVGVFLFPDDGRDILGNFRAQLVESGWKLPSGVFGGGFQTAVIAMLCRASLLVTLRTVPLGDGERALMISLAPGNMLCSPDAKQRMRRGFDDDVEVPSLALPPGVTQTSGGGSSGGGDHNTRHLRLHTTMSCAEVLRWYSAELARGGWRMGAVTVDTNDLAMQWAETRDRRGRAWRGVLTIFTNGPVTEAYLYMTLRPGEGASVPGGGV